MDFVTFHAAPCYSPFGGNLVVPRKSLTGHGTSPGIDRRRGTIYEFGTDFPLTRALHMSPLPSVCRIRRLTGWTFRVGRRILLLLCCCQPLGASETEHGRAGLDLFEKRIRPILVEHCHQCHSTESDEIQAGLRLDSRAGWQQGGDSGPAVRPGEPDQSLVWKAIRYDDDVSPMPPDQKLSDEVARDFAEWIRLGAPDPRSAAEVAEEVDELRDAEKHWAFQPPQIVAPGPDPAGWSQRQLDRYVRDAQRAVGVSPSSAAPRKTLIRRLYFDLVGLPPSYAEVQAFVTDRTPHAYLRLVKELLASPQFGERWARHWLDVARFADTKGYVFQEDRNYPEAYRYRDWVIDSLNQDRPYDEFLRLQLAADVLSSDHPEDLPAMGFLTLGRRFLNNRHDVIDDRIDVVTRGLMALTVSCARCHDHKYDPIPIADYYSLYGVFASCEEPGGEPTALRMVDRKSPQTAYVFRRGNPQNRGEEVPRQFLRLLSGPNREPFRNGSGRAEMAEAIADAGNPLTARVLVNRVWGKLFGSYLVDTPSDFGTRSQQPELLSALDYLAVRFMQNEWSIKWLVEELVTSATYQQASLDRLKAADASILKTEATGG